MTYYLTAVNGQVDFDKAEKFLYRVDKNKSCAVFAVNEKSCYDFLSLTGLSSVAALGSDKSIYSISSDGIKKENENPNISLEKVWKQVCLFSQKLQKESEYRRRVYKKYGSGFVMKSKVINGFNKYFFADKETDTVIPYRFRKADTANCPLFVFFGGGGTVGYDNFKPLFEFLFLSQGSKLNRTDCNILIPQSMHDFGDIAQYAGKCNQIISHLLKENKIDKSRVYVFGNSFGGKCTWNALLKNPELFAAAIPVMGELYDYKNVNFDGIKMMPIWIAHSCDDKVVKIDSDDYCFKALTECGADVKYSRWERYGHKMYTEFYKNENWIEWLLSKSKT